MRILLDTNIIIEHLQKSILSDSSEDLTFAISVITEAELFQLAGLPEVEEILIEEFLRLTKRLNVDSAIARRAGSLNRTRKTELPDLLIAATALEWSLPLLTRNTKDFQEIPELELLKEIP